VPSRRPGRSPDRADDRGRALRRRVAPDNDSSAHGRPCGSPLGGRRDGTPHLGDAARPARACTCFQGEADEGSPGQLGQSSVRRRSISSASVDMCCRHGCRHRGLRRPHAFHVAATVRVVEVDAGRHGVGRCVAGCAAAMTAVSRASRRAARGRNSSGVVRPSRRGVVRRWVRRGERSQVVPPAVEAQSERRQKGEPGHRRLTPHMFN
jgi:hypothetical protein